MVPPGLVAEFGESLVAGLLSSVGETIVLNVSRANLTYDLVVLDENKLLGGPALVMVVTRKHYNSGLRDFPPQWKKFKKCMEESEKRGMKLWIAWVFFNFKNDLRNFWVKIYLIPSDIIDDGWFIPHSRKNPGPREKWQIDREKVSNASQAGKVKVLQTTNAPDILW